MAGFDCELVASDPYVDADEMAEYGVEKVSFEGLLETTDHISIHAPLTKETRHSFDRDAFERMRETAILINVGRGPIVDQTALRRALDAGEIAATGLDVLNEEPPEDSELVGRDDVVVTPHTAFYLFSRRESRRLRRSQDRRSCAHTGTLRVPGTLTRRFASRSHTRTLCVLGTGVNPTPTPQSSFSNKTDI